MTTTTGMGPDHPAPRLDPNCRCICHVQAGVMHLVACCHPPKTYTEAEAKALVAAALQEVLTICEDQRWNVGKLDSNPPQSDAVRVIRAKVGRMLDTHRAGKVQP